MTARPRIANGSRGAARRTIDVLGRFHARLILATLVAVAAIIGLIAFPLLQPTWVFVK